MADTDREFFTDEQLPKLPVYLTVQQAVKLFPVSRTRLYELIDQEAISSGSIKMKGQKLGRRFIRTQSIIDFFESFMNG